MLLHDSSKIRVLLIEDDEDDYVLIRGMLSQVSSALYDLTWAADYDAAIQALDGGRFDVCLLDYRLGNRNGLELLQGAPVDIGKAPIIILTGQGDYETDIEAMKSGAADYLVKDQINEHLLERSIRYSIERKRTEEALRDSEKQLEYLSSQLLLVQEKERRKVAGELHDNLGQILTAIKFMIENIMVSDNHGNTAASSLAALIPLIQDAIGEVRSIYTSLRPTVLDDLGILAAISWYCREFEHDNEAIRIRRVTDVAEEDVPEALKLVIFRILQEAMNNVALHSNAEIVELRLQEVEGNLELTIRDNGTGFDTGQLSNCAHCPGLGIVSMKKRTELSGGVMRVESAPGSGTTVCATWPVGKSIPLPRPA